MASLDWSVDVRAAIAEFLATGCFLFLSLGTGSIESNALTVALVFGTTVAVCVYAAMHYNAGQLNPLVTVALAVTKHVPVAQAIVNVLMQFLAAVVAGALVLLTIPEDRVGDLAANKVQDDFTAGNAFAGEVVGGFILQFVVFETVLNSKHKAGRMGPLAVGLAVFAIHAVMIPVDNCCLNPARAFGPALLKEEWEDFWVFVFGPVIGGLLAIVPHVLLSEDYNLLQRFTLSGDTSKPTSDV